MSQLKDNGITLSKTSSKVVTTKVTEVLIREYMDTESAIVDATRLGAEGWSTSDYQYKIAGHIVIFVKESETTEGDTSK